MDTIFVSSTFEDMQYERDAIQDIVFPKVNSVARQYGQSVSFCDLRWGINTENLDSETTNRKVLEVCLDEIDRSDPPMIVILGDRYGWIPPKASVKEIAKYKKMQLDDYEISTTALEIEFGFFNRRRNTLFYFREVSGTVPKSFKTGLLQRHKLVSFKQKIENNTNDNLTRCLTLKTEYIAAKARYNLSQSSAVRSALHSCIANAT